MISIHDLDKKQQKTSINLAIIIRKLGACTEFFANILIIVIVCIAITKWVSIVYCVLLIIPLLLKIVIEINRLDNKLKEAGSYVREKAKRC